MYMYIHVYMYFMYNACHVCTYVHADMYMYIFMYNIEHAYHMLHVVLVYSTVHVCNYMYKNMCSKCTCFIVSTRKLHMYCANL